jgi:dolichol kinase
MTPEQLDKAALAADCEARTVTWGIAAIGNLLAGAALNESHGLDQEKVADLGWLLQSLGDLAATLVDTHEGARLRTRSEG